MRFVPIKSEQQQSGLMLHRPVVSFWFVNGRCYPMRSALLMAELGIISAKRRNGTA